MKLVNLRNFGLLAIVTGVSAPALADNLNYNYVEAAYIDTEIDDSNFDIDGDGVALGGSFELSDTLFLTAGYSTQDFDFSVDVDQWMVGIGGHVPITDKIDLVGTLSYVDAEVDARIRDFDDDGYGLGVGIRASVAANIELEGGISYIDLDDRGDDTAFAVGGRYYFTPEFALGAGISLGDDVTSFSFGVRYEFQ